MLSNQLLLAHDGLPEEQFSGLTGHIPLEWIDEVFAQEGFAKLRSRRFPVNRVVWLVIGMALLRDRSIAEVVHKLDLALPDGRSVTIAPSAIPKARRRLGVEPVQQLFEKTGMHWAHEQARQDTWRELALYAIDGTQMRVADTPENELHFGKHRVGKNKTEEGYPKLRLTALMALRARILAAACFGPLRDGEQTQARESILPQIPGNSLTILDRLYFDARLLVPLIQGDNERHFLLRLKAGCKYKVIEQLGDADALVQMTVSYEARRKDPTLPLTYKARIIEYMTGKGTSALLTSLLDPQRFPVDEIRSLYHERWEIELGYDELKTDVMLQKHSLRSKSPKAVEQEVWGLLIAYNLVRYEMCQVAKEAGVCPNRISFVAALNFTRDEWMWLGITSSGAIPKRLQQLRQTLKLYVLPKRRSKRLYRRQVKIKDSPYPRKRSKSLLVSLK